MDSIPRPDGEPFDVDENLLSEYEDTYNTPTGMTYHDLDHWTNLGSSRTEP